MFFELIATVAGGFAAAGVVMLLRGLIPAIPRWMGPVAGGAGMLLVTTSLEYSWFDRTRANLPEGVTVALTAEQRAAWQPWTYAVPYVDRFIAVDQAGRRTNPDAEGQVLTSLYVFGRWKSPQVLHAVFDCPGSRRADLGAGDVMRPDGSVAPDAWRDVSPDDEVQATACAGV